MEVHFGLVVYQPLSLCFRNSPKLSESVHTFDSLVSFGSFGSFNSFSSFGILAAPSHPGIRTSCLTARSSEIWKVSFHTNSLHIVNRFPAQNRLACTRAIHISSYISYFEHMPKTSCYQKQRKIIGRFNFIKSVLPLVQVVTVKTGKLIRCSVKYKSVKIRARGIKKFFLIRFNKFQIFFSALL